MNIKVQNIIDKTATILSTESANNMPETCLKYDLGDGSSYQSPGSKKKYLETLIKKKSEPFIISLAKQVIEDYKNDNLASIINTYYDGNYFKPSVITRKELLSDLYALEHINGDREIEEFLKECELERLIPQPEIDLSSVFFNSEKKELPKDISNILKESNIHESIDQRFFAFLEQIVHPYTRNNIAAIPYLTLINKHLVKDGLALSPFNDISGQAVYKVQVTGTVKEHVKNLIFASKSYKPEIVIDDALSNRLRIVKNGEHCLIYDQPIKTSGLLWVDLVYWWSEKNGDKPSSSQATNLKARLLDSLASVPERLLFETYYKSFSGRLKRNLPALIPQVYLHYDPYSIKQYGIQYLLRQRMDFLLLLSDKSRIVIEVDGKQHYAEGEKASPSKYAEMVSLDRELKLLGYEVYRFGGAELFEGNETIIESFFYKLLQKHNIPISSD